MVFPYHYQPSHPHQPPYPEKKRRTGLGSINQPSQLASNYCIFHPKYPSVQHRLTRSLSRSLALYFVVARSLFLSYHQSHKHHPLSVSSAAIAAPLDSPPAIYVIATLCVPSYAMLLFPYPHNNKNFRLSVHPPHKHNRNRNEAKKKSLFIRKSLLIREETTGRSRR